MPENQILVTGATGFVGAVLCKLLSSAGLPYRRAVRNAKDALPGDIVTGEIGPATDWRPALRDVSVVIHLAARTHVMREASANPFNEYRRANVLATARLAQSAADCGVRRLIFLSSIKVNGERTTLQPFRETDEPRPEDAYGITKLEAEQELLRIASTSPLSIAVLRPPLVYGPGVKGNFLVLLRALRRGVPLPLARVENKRSFIYVDNLASAIVTCVTDNRSDNQTFLVSDGEDMSTPELLRRLSSILGSSASLYPVPAIFLRVAGAMPRMGPQIRRLTESLQIDNFKIGDVLGWRPPHSTEQGLAATARWFSEISASR